MKKFLMTTALAVMLVLMLVVFAACGGDAVSQDTSAQDTDPMSEISTQADTSAEEATNAPAEETNTQAPVETAADTQVAPETDAPTETMPEETEAPVETVARVEDTRELTPAEYSVLNITGTDDFGRYISPVDGKTNEDRYVGMFFFLTLGQHDNHNGIFDVNLITANGTNHKAFTDYNTVITPVGSAHFWGEPVWGYYNSEDPWVIRKQVEMLTMAGVDFLVLDTSNNVLYERVTAQLFAILQEYYDQGWDVPKVVYYLGKHDLNADKNVFKQVYNIFYENDTYKDLWFTPNDPEKPMIIAPDNVIDNLKTSALASEKALYDFFDFRVTQWPIDAPVNEPVYEYGAPWIDFTLPQTSQEGWISVSCAQHVSVNMTDIQHSRGRGWTPITYNEKKGEWRGRNDHDNWRMGPNFQAQWDTVLNMTAEEKQQNARFVFLTGWNEWVAQKLDGGNGYYYMCDTYNPEYSRDLEPSRSEGMKDYFYLQTVMNIHNDNYDAAVHYTYDVATPDITKDDTAVWSTSQAVYRDFTGECIARDFKSMDRKKQYVDNSNRNDIDTVTILHDSEYLYFRVTCVSDITAYTAGDTGWMNLWIRTDAAGEETLNGYDFVINRQISGSKTEILRCKSASDMTSVGQGDVNVFGNVMVVRVPLAALGLDENNYHVQFKVTDNVQDMENDILNMYCTGDAAPIGSLNFSYGY